MDMTMTPTTTVKSDYATCKLKILNLMQIVVACPSGSYVERNPPASLWFKPCDTESKIREFSSLSDQKISTLSLGQYITKRKP